MSDQSNELQPDPIPRRFRFSLLSLFILTTISALLAAWFWRPEPVKAVALLYVSPTVPQIVDSGDVDFDAGDYRNVQTAMCKLAVSDAVLNRALSDKKVAAAVKSQAGHDAEPATWLRHRLHVEFPQDSEIFRWTFTGKPRTGKRSSIILDGLVAAFLAKVHKQQKQEYSRQIDELMAQQNELGSHIHELSRRIRVLEQAKNNNDAQVQVLKREASLADFNRIRADIMNLKFARDHFKQIQVLQPATIVNP